MVESYQLAQVLPPFFTYQPDWAVTLCLQISECGQLFSYRLLWMVWPWEQLNSKHSDEHTVVSLLMNQVSLVTSIYSWNLSSSYSIGCNQRHSSHLRGRSRLFIWKWSQQFFELWYFEWVSQSILLLLFHWMRQLAK